MDLHTFHLALNKGVLPASEDKQKKTSIKRGQFNV